MINTVSKPIIWRFGVQKFIETGVFMGDTMMIVQDWFCEMFGNEFNQGPWNQGRRGNQRMYEIEWSREYFEKYIVPRWQQQINVECANADSVDWLRAAINDGKLKPEDRCFFFLDAHSHGSPNPEPMADEIIQIKRLYQPIISIDDWAVPGKNPDIYNTEMIRHLIKDRTDAVYYSDAHNFHGKWSTFIFLDRSASEIDPEISDLPLLKQLL